MRIRRTAVKRLDRRRGRAGNTEDPDPDTTASLKRNW
jgi:hypothetical protein